MLVMSSVSIAGCMVCVSIPRLGGIRQFRGELQPAEQSVMLVH